MIVATTGGRYFDFNRQFSYEKFLKFWKQFDNVKNILIVGGATGWDAKVAHLWHHTFQLPYVTVPAAWDRTGRAAGPARNIHMMRGNSLAPYAHLKPDVLVAGPGGRGTAQCVRQARERGIEVAYYAEN